MIKRKGEKIMGIISIVLNAIGVGFGALILSVGPSFYDEINEVLKEEGETLPIETLQASVHAFGTQFMVVSAIAAVLSIVGVIFLKTDRRAVLSGILFLGFCCDSFNWNSWPCIRSNGSIVYHWINVSY